jgi:hypothetical protein
MNTTTGTMTPEQLRDGIFQLNTRRFGTVAEIMIRKLQSLDKARSIFHDLYDQSGDQRVEVKFSTVRRNLSSMDHENIIESIQAELVTDRSVDFSGWQQHKFLCNIQQVKKTEFDVLYYGMFFNDCIKIFRITPADINSDIRYGDKQHKGNTGEGQFHISEKTLDIHLNKFYHSTLTYQQLLDLLS